MKWIGQHIWDLRSRFRNTVSIGKDSNTLLNIDQSTSDISTWQLQPENFYVGSTEPTPEAIFFKPDGTKMYILCRSGDDINEYALSTAWDASTASYTDALTGLGSSPASEPNPYGMYISPDGIYLYIVGHSTDQVVQYTMSVAWDVSTASYTREQNLTDAGGTFADPTGIHFKPDGTMFWACSYAEDTIQQYILSTAWDVSTLSTGDSFSLIDFFTLNKLDGTTLSDISSGEDLFFSEDGTKVWVTENSYDSVHQLDLSIAWDITTITYSGRGVRFSPYHGSLEGLYVNEDAGKAFTISTSGDRVRSFNIGGTVFSSANNASVAFESGIGVKGDSVFNGLSSFGDIYAQTGYFYGGFNTYSTTSLTHGNGGTVNILDGTTYNGDSLLDVMTNVYWGANGGDQSVQENYRHEINLGKPRGGSKVTLNIGRRVGGGGEVDNHTGVMEVVSMAQTFDHYGSLDVGRTLQVDGKADLEVFDLGGTVVFNDAFTETNTTAIESHTPDLGAGWTKVFDTGSTTTFNIIGGGGYGQLSNSETSDGVIFLADTTPTGVDYEVRVDFKRRDSGDDVFLIIIKYQDANNYYALQWSASYSTYCKLFRVEGGSVVNVESNFNYGAVNQTTDNYSTALKLRFIDNTLMVWDIDNNDYKAFRGSYPVTTDFNDGNGGTYHKVGMAFGDLFGGSLDATTTWKIDKFEVKMLSSAATLAAATKSYVDAGSFGVGITNPTSKFHVVGDARIQGNLTVNGTYTQIDTDVTTTEQWLVTNDGTGPAAVINQLGTEDIFDVQDDGTSVFYIEDGGQIGMGTTSPTARLHIESVDDAVIRLKSTDNKAYIALSDNDSYGYISSENGKLSLGAAPGVNANNLNIDLSNNNVGIGTTSPGSTLDVKGTTTDNSAKAISAQNSSGAELFYVRNDGVVSVNNGYLYAQHSSGAYFEGSIKARGGITDDGGTLGLGASGDTSQLNIIGGGNVGIGTTAPEEKLSVSGSIQLTNQQELTWADIGDGNTGRVSIRGNEDDDWIMFKTDNSERMRLTNTGLGIGTTSPSQKLHVNGNIRVGNSTDAFYGNRFTALSNADVELRSNNGYDLILNANAGDNVGIGTTSPEAKLDVESEILISGTDPILRMERGDGFNSDIIKVESSTDNIIIGDTSLDEMIFEVDNGEAIRITRDKKVGIGTDSPSRTLHVKKTGDNEVARFESDQTSSYIELEDANTTGQILIGTQGDNFKIHTAGTERMRITDTGSVGIGTTSPSQKLDVAGAINIQDGYTLRYNNSSNISILGSSSTGLTYTGIEHHFKAYDGSSTYSEYMTIDTGGKVGIGTTSPTSKLQVEGTAFINTGVLKMTKDSVTNYYEEDKMNSYGTFYDWKFSGNHVMRIKSDGNVGIGTTSPAQKLHIENGNIQLSDSKYITWGNGGNNAIYGNNSSDFIKIFTNGAERLIVNSSGNVGIGTTSPGNKLEVHSGTTNVGGVFKSSDNQAWISVQDDDSGTYGALFGTDSDAGHDIVLADRSANKRLVIDTSGSVGIGQTSPAHKLDVAGYIRSANTGADSTTKYSGFFGRHYTNSEEDVLAISTESTISNNNIYIGGGFGTRNSATTIRFSTAANNTTTTGTERMRITNDGNVGIGTTSPSSKLHVDGSATFTGSVGITGTGNLTVRNTSGAGSGIIFLDNIWQAGIEHDSGKLHFRTGGQNDRVTISSGGNVGIGNTSPINKLDVAGDLSVTSIKIGSSASGEGIIRHSGGSGYGIGIVTGSIDSSSIGLFVDHSANNRNVGIGTTSPSKKLEVVDTSDNIQLVLKGATNGNSGIRFTDGVDADSATIYYYHVDKRLRFFVDNAEALNIIPGGNVGIGTTSPGAKLEVSSTGNVAAIINSSSTFTFLDFEKNGANRVQIGNASAGDFIIRTSELERMRIDSSGNVGIGTTSPGEKLEVDGNIKIGDSDFIKIGNGDDLQIYHNATDSWINNANGNLLLVQNANDKDIVFYCDDGSGGVTPYLTIDGSAGHTTVQKTMRFDDNARADFGAGYDLQIKHDGTNSYIDNGSGDFYIRQKTADKDLIFQCDDGSGGETAYLTIDGSATRTNVHKDFRFDDNIGAVFGSGAALKLHSDGSNGLIDNYQGSLIIRQQVDDADIAFQCDDGSGGVATYLTIDGSATRTNVHKNMLFDDSVTLGIGAGYDLQLYHNGSTSLITNQNGNLLIRNQADDSDIIFQTDDGSGGETAYLTLDGTNVRNKFHKDVNLEDNVQLQIGNSQDLKLYHSGTHSYISQEGVGNLYIQTLTDDGDIIFMSDDGSGSVEEYFRLDGSANTAGNPVTIFPDNSTLQLGSSTGYGDLQLLHNGTNSYIQNGFGQLYINQNVNDGDIVLQSDDGSGGVTPYLTLDGSATRTIFNENAQLVDSKYLYFGTGADAFIRHDGSNWGITNTAGNINIKNATDDGDIIFESDDGSGGTTEYLRIDGGEGRLVHSVNSRYLDNVVAMFGTGGDMQILHDGSNSYISQNVTGNLYIQQNANDKDLVLQCDDGSGGTTAYLTLDGGDERVVFSKEARLNDSVGLKLGSAGDLHMYHDGSNSYMRQVGTGNLYIDQLVDDSDIVLRSDDGSGGVTPYLTLDGSSGYTKAHKHILYEDSTRAWFGNGGDMYINHDGTNSYIENETGNLYILNRSDDKDIIFQSDNGSGGLATYFSLDGSLADGTYNYTKWPDYSIACFGSSNDLCIWHDSNNSYIRQVGTGDLIIENITNDKDIILKSDNGSGGTTAYLTLDGSTSTIEVAKPMNLVDDLTITGGNGGQLTITSGNAVWDAAIVLDTGDSNGQWKVYAEGSDETFRIENVDQGGAAALTIHPTTKTTTFAGNIAVSGSVQRQISTTHHTFTFGAAGTASQDYWVPFIGNSELASPNVTHRTIAPYGGILKKAIVHSTVAYGSSAQVRFHIIDNGTASVFANDNSTDDVTTNVTADMSTAYSSVAFDFTTGNTFSAGDQIGVSFVRNNTGLGDVAITLVWEYELF